MQTPDDDDLQRIEHHVFRYGGQQRAARRIGDVMSDLFARRGYAQVQSTAELQEVWACAVGKSWAKHSRPVGLRRGVLQVVVQNSMAMQELVFQKQQLLRQIRAALEDEKIRDLRFRIGPVEN